MVEDIIRSVVKSSVNIDDDGVKIETAKEANYIDFDNNSIGVWKRPKSSDKPTSEWVTGDFVSLARWLHYSRYKKDWDLNFRAACVEALHVRDEIVDFYGFCDNVVFKDFIEFFFRYFADDFIRKSKRFLFVQMKNDKVLDRFFSEYDYRSRIDGKELKFENKTSMMQISKDNLQKSRALSLKRFILDFGLVICVNYEHIFMNKKPSMATKTIFDECRKIKKRNGIDAIRGAVEVTELYSPYPSWLPFLSVDKLVKKIDSSLSVNIEIDDSNEEFNFMRTK